MLNSSDNMTFKPIRGVNMDVLSDILDKVQLTSSYWYRTSFAGDWGINLPKEDNFARFHIVTHGEFWYEVPKLKLKALAEQGDILILFKGMEHTMTSAPKIKAETAVEFRAKGHLTEAQVLEYGDQSKLKQISFADTFVLMVDPIIHFSIPCHKLFMSKVWRTLTRRGSPCF